jgi:hypothetical protein
MIFVLAITLYTEVQRKPQAEIDQVIGPNRLPNIGDQEPPPYANAIILEVVRWQPVTPLGESDSFRLLFDTKQLTLLIFCRIHGIYGESLFSRADCLTNGYIPGRPHATRTSTPIPRHSTLIGFTTNPPQLIRGSNGAPVGPADNN